MRIVITDQERELGALEVDFGSRGPFHIVIKKPGQATHFLVEHNRVVAVSGDVEPIKYFVEGALIELDIEWERPTTTAKVA